MSQENSVTLTGNLTHEPKVLRKEGSPTMVSLRMAVNRRRQDPGTGTWGDVLDGYFTVVAWRDLAENAAASLQRGQRVTVVGRLSLRQYTVGEEVRSTVEVVADEVAPSLRWVRAEVQPAPRRNTAGAAPAHGPHDPSADGSQSAPAPDEIATATAAPF